MIADYLDRDYVLSETRAHRDGLVALQKKVLNNDKESLAALREHNITPQQLTVVIHALDDALARAKKDKKHPQGTAYLPSDPVTCGLQAGLTQLAIENNEVRVNPTTPPPTRSRGRSRGPAKKVVDTSPLLRLKRRAVTRTKGATRAPFIEGEDAHYALDGFKAKFGALFRKRRRFNTRPARIARSTKPLSLYVFGDWGSGLSLANKVAQQISEQIANSDSSRQQHVIHLGDVYYVGDPDEYKERMFPFWPVTSAQRRKIGSWSLNGNHDMYCGGGGYFDTLLKKDHFFHWHRDDNNDPSSFFLIEDNDWQVFGLDTAWNLPSLSSAIIGKPTLKDYGGQNGILTQAQVKWMAKVRDPSKGCILLTHHQPASSRSTEKQHADEAVALLKSKGVYAQIDAWIWGHEHRAVVFKPKAQRRTKRLRDAPNFCACLGHGGVPVTKKNLNVAKKRSDVLWEEDRLGTDAPLYEGQRVVPFGFGRIDTKPGEFEFKLFDHTGELCYDCTVTREESQSTSRGSKNKKTRTKAKPPAKAKARAQTKKPIAQADSDEVADWTILVYMAGDNDLDDFGGDDIQEMKTVGSSDRIHVLVQRDTAAAGVPTHRYRIRKGTKVENDVVETIGETNTGDPKVLADFLQWGLANYPAKRTMAVLWNHGSGWDDTDIYAEAKRRGLNPSASRSEKSGAQRRSGVRGRVSLPGGFINRNAARKRHRGSFFLTAYQLMKVGGNRRAIGFDDDAQDFLDSVEMKNVFKAAAKKAKRKFDVIGMDACLMSMVETGLQVREAGKVFCGSQEIEPGAGWPYGHVLKALSANPSMDGKALCQVIVKEFVASYKKSEPVTQSAFDLDALTRVQTAANELGAMLAKACKKRDFAVRGAIADARRRAQGYDHPDYVDLVDFSSLLAENIPAYKAKAKKIRDAVGACVFANHAPHPRVSASCGLSIYLPVGKVSPLYNNLDFSKSGGWADFIAAHTT